MMINPMFGVRGVRKLEEFLARGRVDEYKPGEMAPVEVSIFTKEFGAGVTGHRNGNGAGNNGNGDAQSFTVDKGGDYVAEILVSIDEQQHGPASCLPMLMFPDDVPAQAGGGAAAAAPLPIPHQHGAPDVKFAFKLVAPGVWRWTGCIRLDAGAVVVHSCTPMRSVVVTEYSLLPAAAPAPAR